MDARHAEVFVTASDGTEFRLFDVDQGASGRNLWLTPASKTVTSAAIKLGFAVETNTSGWDLVGYDEGITIVSVDKETNMIVFSVPANDAPGAVERKLRLYVNTTDTPVIEKIYTLTQKYPNQP